MNTFYYINTAIHNFILFTKVNKFVYMRFALLEKLLFYTKALSFTPSCLSETHPT